MAGGGSFSFFLLWWTGWTWHSRRCTEGAWWFPCFLSLFLVFSCVDGLDLALTPLQVMGVWGGMGALSLALSFLSFLRCRCLGPGAHAPAGRTHFAFLASSVPTVVLPFVCMGVRWPSLRCRWNARCFSPSFFPVGGLHLALTPVSDPYATLSDPLLLCLVPSLMLQFLWLPFQAALCCLGAKPLAYLKLLGFTPPLHF